MLACSIGFDSVFNNHIDSRPVDTLSSMELALNTSL